MRLTRRIVIQLAIVAVIALTAGAVMGVGYMGLPAMLFGIGRYTVKAELPEAGGLYRTGNVTYRGTEVGRVESVQLTDSGVEATLSLNSKYKIPSDLDAQVHSQSAVSTSRCCHATRRPGRCATATSSRAAAHRYRRTSTACSTPQTAAYRRSRRTT
jgi:phospholipid/cholesterol/gamma-HCH transport system substrate-binding protein